MKLKSVAGSVIGPLAMGTVTVLFTMCGKERHNPESGIPVPEPPAHIDTLYVTGVEYPAGYDWIKDQDYGTVQCRLFLEKNGERIVDVPVGYFYETASDPDMHRCIGGHLYTDYSSDTETVIKKDGTDLFRYQGREMITGFHVSDSCDVYTVGQSRSGEQGFRFRKNGQTLLSVDAGHAISDIHEKDGRMYLAYKQEEQPDRDHGSAPGYYLYDGERPVLFSEISGDEEIMAAVSSGSSVIYAAAYAVSDLLQAGYLYSKGKKYPLSGVYGNLVSCRILQDGDNIYLTGICHDSTGEEYRYVVWNDTGDVLYAMAPGEIPYYSFVKGGTVYDFVQSEGIFNDISCFRNGQKLYTYGQDLSSYGNTPAAVCRDTLYFAFSDRAAGRKPCIAADDDVRDCTFNGFFSGVSAW